MQIIKAVIGAIVLFLGRELTFLFAAAMAALIALRVLPNLPDAWPGYYDYIFIGGLALLAAVLSLTNERVGYILSGFLAGGYFLVEYFAPGASTLPALLFLAGGIVGALILGIFTEWAMIVISSVIGAYYVMTLFVLSPTAQILVTAGLFVIGGVTQAIIMRMQKS